MSKTLREVLGDLVIWGGDDEGNEVEWTLEELNSEASWDIRNVITKHLESLKHPVAKKLVFGDTTSRDNAIYNGIIDQVILDIEEGRL